MGAESETAMIVVKLVAVAAMIFLLVMIPVKLLGSSEDDDVLMQRSTILLGETVDELLQNPASFASKEVMLTLPKGDDFVILAYDSEIDAPESCFQYRPPNDLFGGGSRWDCSEANGEKVKKVDMCDANACICYFKREIAYKDLDDLNKQVKYCHPIEYDAGEIFISGYYPFEINDQGLKDIQNPVDKYRGANRDLSVLQNQLPLDYQYFMVYTGKYQRTSGVNFYRIEKAIHNGKAYVLISPLGERLENRGLKEDCPIGSGVCNNKYHGELLDNGVSPDGDLCTEKSFCEYNIHDDICEPTCAGFCEQGPVSEPCFCNGIILRNGVCDYGPEDLPANCDMFQSCNDYCSRNEFYNGLLIDEDHQDIEGWCSGIGRTYCAEDPCNVGNDCYIAMPVANDDVNNPLHGLVTCTNQ